MILSDAFIIIEDNKNSENNSFLDFAHERNQFNEIAYWDFYNAIKCIANADNDNFSREVVWKIIKPYEWFLLLIGMHFDKNDQYEMENIPDNYSAYSIRLREVVDAYIKGEKIDGEN